MSVTLGTIALPDDSVWVDEFDWSGVDAVSRHTLGGRLVVEQFSKESGRPITLSSMWVTRAVLTELEQVRDERGFIGTVTIEDGRSFPVKFRHEENKVIEVTPVIDRPDYTDNSVPVFFNVIIKLIQI